MVVAKERSGALYRHQLEWSVDRETCMRGTPDHGTTRVSACLLLKVMVVELSESWLTITVAFDSLHTQSLSHIHTSRQSKELVSVDYSK